MKALKITGIIIGSIIALFIIAFGIYLLMNIQGEAEEFEIGNIDSEKRILIASQGSEFKDALVLKLIEELVEDSIFVKVLDVSKLSEINEENWDAAVLIHTTEQWKLQPDVDNYLERVAYPDRIIVVSTSGSGEWKTDKYDVDIYTSASRMSTVDSLSGKIIEDLMGILEQKTEREKPE